MALEINNLTKEFGKHKKALSDYSIRIDKGVLGLLGPNGAGKSTLMKIIATISKPTAGTLSLDGENIVSNPDYIRRLLGYLPQDFGLYQNLSGYEFLEYIAALKGVGGPNLRRRIEMLLEGVNLIAEAHRLIGTYSGGMKQRIGIAQALLNDPKVLIFDEPTVGLDPEERARFRQLISDLAGDSIIILSSHIVSDIETIADQVAVMQGGKLIAMDCQSNIIALAVGKLFEVIIPATALATFKANYKVIHTARQGEQVRVRYIAEVACSAESYKAVKPTLEDAYFYLTQKPIPVT